MPTVISTCDFAALLAARGFGRIARGGRRHGAQAAGRRRLRRRGRRSAGPGLLRGRGSGALRRLRAAAAASRSAAAFLSASACAACWAASCWAACCCAACCWARRGLLEFGLALGVFLGLHLVLLGAGGDGLLRCAIVCFRRGRAGAVAVGLFHQRVQALGFGEVLALDALLGGDERVGHQVGQRAGHRRIARRLVAQREVVLHRVVAGRRVEALLAERGAGRFAQLVGAHRGDGFGHGGDRLRRGGGRGAGGGTRGVGRFGSLLQAARATPIATRTKRCIRVTRGRAATGTCVHNGTTPLSVRHGGHVRVGRDSGGRLSSPVTEIARLTGQTASFADAEAAEDVAEEGVGGHPPGDLAEGIVGGAEGFGGQFEGFVGELAGGASSTWSAARPEGVDVAGAGGEGAFARIRGVGAGQMAQAGVQGVEALRRCGRRRRRCRRRRFARRCRAGRPCCGSTGAAGRRRSRRRRRCGRRRVRAHRGRRSPGPRAAIPRVRGACLRVRSHRRLRAGPRCRRA